MSAKKKRILFIVENNFFPNDIRVFNECKTLSEVDGYRCFVLAPKGGGESFFERIGSVKCYRYLHFDSFSTIGLFIEYFIAALWFLFYVPIIVLRNRINVIHIANPPDFLILLIYWLKLFGIKMVFDHHDLSLMVLKGKFANEGSYVLKLIMSVLSVFEWCSIRLADKCIASNNSIRDHGLSLVKKADITVVRNSSWSQFKDISSINKQSKEILHLGYFGVIGGDNASGLSNFVLIAKLLKGRGVNFKFTVIGNGPGLEPLKALVVENSLVDVFTFTGYVKLQDAYSQIIDFDFGILPWPVIPKNELLSAIKVMNYMCCAVPACTLNLKEQLVTTDGIGIHTDSFEEMVDLIIELRQNVEEYEELRRRTLYRFNTVLSWEGQRDNLISVYQNLK